MGTQRLAITLPKLVYRSLMIISIFLRELLREPCKDSFSTKLTKLLAELRYQKIAHSRPCLSQKSWSPLNRRALSKIMSTDNNRLSHNRRFWRARLCWHHKSLQPVRLKIRFCVFSRNRKLAGKVIPRARRPSSWRTLKNLTILLIE